jgi:predicted small secreted protein
MSEIKLDIPDITVLIDKGDEYRVVVNKPGSIVKNISGSYITVADSALTSSYALSASYIAGGTVSSASYANYAVTASYLDGDAGITDWTEITNKPANIVSSSVQTIQNISGSNITTNKVESNEFKILAGNVSLTFTGSVTTGIFGATEYVLPFIPTSSFTAAMVEYVATRPGALRVGNILAGWSGSSVTSTDVSNTDIGDTSDMQFSVVQDNGYIKLRVTSLGSGSYSWTVQSLFKLFPTLP